MIIDETIEAERNPIMNLLQKIYLAMFHQTNFTSQSLDCNNFAFTL